MDITLDQINAAIRYKRRRKIEGYFPETGPLSRHNYPKHMDFYAAGMRYSERLFVAANKVGKCILFDSAIETEVGPRRIGDIWKANERVKVWAWDGVRPVLAQASDPIEKPETECYRITLSDGQFIECAGEHRVLTSGSWRFVRDLVRFYEDRQVSNAGPFRLVHVSGGPRSSRSVEGFPASCSGNSRRYDGPLPMIPEIGQSSLRQRGDVPQPASVSSRADDLECRYTNSGQREHARLSIQYDQNQHEVRCAVSGSGNACTIAERSFGPIRESVPRSPESLRLRYASGPLEQGCQTDASPFLNTSNRIISIKPIGRHKVYDLEVERFHNYIAGGLIHHNTQGLAYETVKHATGIYPPWWTGKRWNRPISGWICNTNWDSVRDVNQLELIGPPAQESEWGTGMIPGDSIKDIQRNGHVKNGILLVQVKYKDSASEVSELQFKNYEQGRESFQGTNKDWIWPDEEVPSGIYEEMLLRTMVCGGHIAMSYTPIMGMTTLTMGFLGGIQEEQAEEYA